ncbi:hypothetical protein CQ018_13715 [Arthrobacter sp. MYb227]|uniref:hypothetical protein n=1 Tax=Arthrobacter sp. MYb227 TaxID=1848601 RepID=UPI000CFB75F8|nr:hypothetical protein [Arthrobacter sp. MYb227]PQZ91682.1 hypothetical protein CQ018_13715 [Arthrobacter sp. MYb227]
MGFRNVSKVYTYWRHLGHREVRLLTFFALMANDDAFPPRYFGGWQSGAEALGLDPYGERQRSAAEVFRKASAALRQAGAIVSSGSTGGSRSEYALTLEPTVTYAPSIAGYRNGHPVINWEPMEREHLPQQNVGAQPQQNVAAQPQQNVGNSPNDSLGPIERPQQLEEKRDKSDHLAGYVTKPVDRQDQNQIRIPEPQSDSARAYLNERPGQHTEFMQQARHALGNDANLSQCLVHAATLAGWKWDNAA